MNLTFVRALPVALLALVACAAAETDNPEQTDEAAAAAVACADVKDTKLERSMAVTDPEVLAKFSFQRTMSAIRTTANIAPGQTNLSIYQEWMKTFGTVAEGGTCDAATTDPNAYGLVCPREPERKLAGINPFAAPSGFTPVALFNRFDLAPSKGQNCGEHRIVYALQGALSGRAFIIFEAALPNPHPERGVDACLPVARFWQGLSAVKDVATRAARLEKLYFTGGAIAGFEPVVTAAHYGLSTNSGARAAGQVRTNFFIDGAQWHLREFKTHRECTDAANPATCKLSLEHVTVKNNPANELFAGTHERSAAFRTSFANQVPKLAAGTAATIGMSIGNAFNEYESISQPFTPFGDVEYNRSADPAMRAAIQTKLTAMGSKLSVNSILQRATTQTCAGCHRLSAGDALGGTVGQWPSDGGFVHVNEGGGLSPALTGTFIPRRITVLEKFINDRCGPAARPAGGAGGAAAEDDDSTLGGSAVGAPN
jgi:hypothetical protein